MFDNEGEFLTQTLQSRVEGLENPDVKSWQIEMWAYVSAQCLKMWIY